jgi:glycosyltransferase involved in cell wall biosynthesis
VYNVFLFLRRFNAIIINHPFCYLYTLLISPKKKVIIFHSPWCFEYKYRTPKFKKVAFLIRYLIEKFTYQNATNIITLSTYSKRVCSFLFKVNRANIHIIPPSVDIEEFEQITDKNPQNKILAEASHKIVFLTARAMIPRTGINLLIDAIELIKDKLHNTLFLIAGEGPYLEQYRQLVAKKGLSDIVKFVGFLEREKLITYFYTSDCFILPSSKLEGFGLVLLEAMYANLPIIATPVGAIPEVLKNMPYCYLTKSKTPQALAEKILEFIDNKINKSNINLKERFLTRYPSYQQIADQILTLIK